MPRKEQFLKLVGDQRGKKYYNKLHLVMNCIDALQVVESFLLPREAFNMKSTSAKLKNLQITGKLSLFHKENSVQVFRDLEFFPPKHEITWEDPENLISDEHKENLEECLRLDENDRPNCLFDMVFDEVSDPYTESYPFFKEVLFAVLPAVDGERRRKGNRVLLKTAIELSAHEDVARLIKRNTDVNLEEILADGTYKKALHLAALDGELEIARILLEAGAEVDGRAEYGHTALIFAVRYQNVEMVELLLKWGANVNAVNRWSKTALHEAARKGYVEIVKVLLNAGANTKQKSKFGETAAEIAEQRGHQNCADEIIAFDK